MLSLIRQDLSFIEHLLVSTKFFLVLRSVSSMIPVSFHVAINALQTVSDAKGRVNTSQSRQLEE